MYPSLQWCFGPRVSLSLVPVWSYLVTSILVISTDSANHVSTLEWVWNKNKSIQKVMQQGNLQLWIAGWASLEERFIICVPSNARITINIQVEVAAVLRAYFGHIALLTTSQDVNLYTKSSRMEIPNSRSFSLQRGVRGYPPRNRFLQGLGRGAGHSIILCTPQAGITYINKHSSKRQSSPAYDIGRWLSLQDFEDVVPISSPFK